MGKYGKWIAGGLGWAFLGPLGGLVGFALGSMMDSPDIKTLRRPGTSTTGDFAMSLVVLVAAVMKADGRILQSELEYVKNYFIRSFGQETGKEVTLLLRDILKVERDNYV